MRKKDIFENNIGEKLRNFQSQPSSRVWKELEAGLDNTRKLSRQRYIKYAAAIILLLATAWGIYEALVYIGTPHDQVADVFSPKPSENVEISEKTKPDIISEKEVPDIYQEITVSEIEDTDFFLPVKQEKDKKKIAAHVIDSLKPVMHEEEFVSDIFETSLAGYSIIKTTDDITISGVELKQPAVYARSISEQDPYFDDIPERNRWSVGIKIAPQYAFRINSSEPEVLYRGKAIFEQNEKHLYTYNLGIDVKYQLSNKISLESGLQYIRMGQSIRNINIYHHPGNESPFGILPAHVNHPQSVLTSMGEIHFTDPTLYFDDISAHRVLTLEEVNEPDDVLLERGDRLNQHLGFLEVPLTIRYNLYDGLVKIQLKGGVGFNYLVNNSVVLQREGFRNSIGTTSLIRNWNSSITGGVALQVPVTDKLNFYIEPSANLFISSMTYGREYNVYPYGISLYTGLGYAF